MYLVVKTSNKVDIEELEINPTRSRCHRMYFPGLSISDMGTYPSHAIAKFVGPRPDSCRVRHRGTFIPIEGTRFTAHNNAFKLSTGTETSQ